MPMIDTKIPIYISSLYLSFISHDLHATFQIETAEMEMVAFRLLGKYSLAFTTCLGVTIVVN